MIDRTTLDLRLTDHSATIARVNQSGWQHGQPIRHPVRAALASALVALATRLVSGQLAAGPLGQSGQEQSATA